MNGVSFSFAFIENIKKKKNSKTIFWMREREPYFIKTYSSPSSLLVFYSENLFYKNWLFVLFIESSKTIAKEKVYKIEKKKTHLVWRKLKKIYYEEKATTITIPSARYVVLIAPTCHDYGSSATTLCFHQIRLSSRSTFAAEAVSSRNEWTSKVATSPTFHTDLRNCYMLYSHSLYDYLFAVTIFLLNAKWCRLLLFFSSSPSLHL